MGAQMTRFLGCAQSTPLPWIFTHQGTPKVSGIARVCMLIIYHRRVRSAKIIISKSAGGHCKAAIDEGMMTGKIKSTEVSKVVNYLKRNHCKVNRNRGTLWITRRNFFEIDNTNLTPDSELSHAKPIDAIQSSHFWGFQITSRFDVQVRKYSCYSCQSCLIGEFWNCSNKDKRGEYQNFIVDPYLKDKSMTVS
jgi:hypothetical protein